MIEATGSTKRITGDDLLAVGGSPKITARTLEHWRHEGLLPKAERTGQHGKRPVWTYPAETTQQLAALLRLREKTKDPDLLRAALWFEGFPIDVHLVRTSITTVLQRFLKQFLTEIEKCQDAHGEASNEGIEIFAMGAIDHLAHKAAGARGSKALPRYGRQRHDERSRAVALFLRSVLTNERLTTPHEQDGVGVERMIGLDHARHPQGGVAAWLDGSPGDWLESFPRFGSFPALIQAVETASDEELEASRLHARLLFTGITAVARHMSALISTPNPVGMGVLATLHADPVIAVLVPALVISLRRSPVQRDNLEAIVNGLGAMVLPQEAQLREWAALSKTDLLRQLPGLEHLPFGERRRFQRLIDSARTAATAEASGPSQA